MALTTISKLENLKEVIQLMINRGSVTVDIVRKVLEIPQKIFEGTDAMSTLQKIAELLDVNGDKKYTSEDFILLNQQLQQGNLGLYLSMVSILSGLVHTAAQLNKLNLTTDEIIELSIKLILYAILIPVMKCENIADWAKEIAVQSTGKSNLDCLFDLLEIIYTTLVNSQAVKNVVGKVINFIGTTCWLSCCKSVTDKSDVITVQNMPKVEHEVLGMMKTKNTSSVSGIPITEIQTPSSEEIIVTTANEQPTNSAPPNQHTIVIPVTVPTLGDTFVLTIPQSSLNSLNQQVTSNISVTTTSSETTSA